MRRFGHRPYTGPPRPLRQREQYLYFGKIPVIRYVCCSCGYVENWVEDPASLQAIRTRFG